MIDADVLRPPRHRVDRRFVLWRTVRAVIGAVVVLVPLGVLYLIFEVARPWIGPVWLVLAVCYLIGIAITPTWRYRVHRWEATDDAVYALEGWLTRKWQIVPISRIQSIDTEIGPIQNLLGIATIKVTTASSEGGISIEGLERTAAETTVDRLRAVTAATPGDAT
ncbi:membrane protein YdbS with pleckstrin-like domain [Catenuloplanes nepalensis]|uniref:Membrane protein YdbS with pleckstrin-like domain n=1 Tax=Catenuloplanes nepalensis TaxID=587533 RepID=A0ABT9MRB0_9ACTN|nr:PH domain-containing protein [Catenuloplanes nepalensis]MDP9793924.1 membrane protein YdbS with pleckstrin-like domain [Catenuloplanes nepalensis]